MIVAFSYSKACNLCTLRVVGACQMCILILQRLQSLYIRGCQGLSNVHSHTAKFRICVLQGLSNELNSCPRGHTIGVIMQI